LESRGRNLPFPPLSKLIITHKWAAGHREESSLLVSWRLNSKFETRNPKQSPNPNSPMTEKVLFLSPRSYFGHSRFEFASIFVLRYSNFRPPNPLAVPTSGVQPKDVGHAQLIKGGQKSLPVNSSNNVWNAFLLNETGTEAALVTNIFALYGFSVPKCPGEKTRDSIAGNREGFSFREVRGRTIRPLPPQRSPGSTESRFRRREHG
jgi:hypothetical protein